MAGEVAPSDLECKIIKQVEYYFGNANLPRDKFLKEIVLQNEGWVTMDTMLKFNRLKNLSDDKQVVCDALKKSDSGLMEVSDDLSKIRRSPGIPLPDNTVEWQNDVNSRSVYIKGFPQDSSIDDLMEFFEQYGCIDSIFMRRRINDKVFKGSVYAVFSSISDAVRLLELNQLQYKDIDLIKMKKDEHQKSHVKQSKQKSQVLVNSQTMDVESSQQLEEKKMEEMMRKGTVFVADGLPKDTALDELKNFFADFCTVAWVEFKSGDEKAFIRLAEEAAPMLERMKEKNEGRICFNSVELEARVLEGEEEKMYWRRMLQDISTKKKNFKQKFGKKRKFADRSNQGIKGDGADTTKKCRQES